MSDKKVEKMLEDVTQWERPFTPNQVNLRAGRDEAFQVLKMSPSSELFKTDFYLKQEVKLTHPGGDAEESGDKIQREGE